MKLVIYTAIVGDKDKLHTPRHILPGVDYVCFTDSQHLHSPVFQIRPLPFHETSPVFAARKLKFFAHELFPDHDASLWIDGSKEILRDLSPLLEAAFSASDFTALCHPTHTTIAEEADACIKGKRDSYEKINQQLQEYRKAGMEDGFNRLVQTGILFRRHHQPIPDLMQAWWKAVLQHSTRDQISLPFILWKHRYKMHVLDHDAWHDNYFLQHLHLWHPKNDNRNQLGQKFCALGYFYLKKFRLFKPLQYGYRRLRF